MPGQMGFGANSRETWGVSPIRKRGQMGILGVVACPLLLAAFLYGPQARVGSKAQPSDAVKDFAEGFYSWYVPRAIKAGKTPAWSVALKYKRDVFSATLFRALREDSDAQAKASGIIVGLDFDPFLNAQDPCKRYEVGTVTFQGAGYRVDIYGVCSGKKHGKPDIVAEVAHQGSSWVFTNFLYPATNSDLLGTLKLLRKERQKATLGP